MVQQLHIVYVPIARVYPLILLVNHIRGTVFKLLYINISNDSPYFHCPDEERFYPFEILAFRTLKLYLFRVVVFAFNIQQSPWTRNNVKIIFVLI